MKKENILKKIIKQNTKKHLESIFSDYEKLNVIHWGYEIRKNMILNNPNLEEKLINEITDKTIYFIDNIGIEKKENQELLEKEIFNIITIFLDLIILD